MIIGLFKSPLCIMLTYQAKTHETPRVAAGIGCSQRDEEAKLPALFDYLRGEGQ